MAVRPPRRGPQLPRPPRKVPVNPGPLAGVKDPMVRLLMQQLSSRITEQDSRLTTLDTYALKAGSPIDAFGQRVRNVARPTEKDDAVPLWFLRQFVETEEALARRRSGSGEGGDGGPTLEVPLADLFSVVQGYANANPAQLAASCLSSGGTWDFMDGCVAALMAADARVGWCGQRGVSTDIAEDAVCYWGLASMPPQPGEPGNYVVDIIGGHCGPSPTPAWNSVTPAGAVWLPARV